MTRRYESLAPRAGNDFVCWDHGCNGLQFSRYSDLLQHRSDILRDDAQRAMSREGMRRLRQRRAREKEKEKEKERERERERAKARARATSTDDDSNLRETDSTCEPGRPDPVAEDGTDERNVDPALAQSRDDP